MADHDQKGTPGAVVALTAFNYAVKFFDYAATRYPELSRCDAEVRNSSLQAAIVASLLIQQERRSPQDAAKLAADIVRGFPPSARRRSVAAVQALAAYALRRDREALRPDEIPSLAEYAPSSDDRWKTTLAVWLGGVVMGKWTLGDADKPTAAAMARSAWTSAVMIGRTLERRGK